MKLNFIVYLLFVMVVNTGICQSTDSYEIPSNTTLIFQDNFNRNEEDETVENIGKKWRTNSKNRAKDNKQADLRNGVLFVKMYEGANHGTSIVHPVRFSDGIVKVKFKMLHEKGLNFNFNDPNATHLAHAGHVCQIKVLPKRVSLIDHITGRFEKGIHKKRKEGSVSKEELKKLLKGKSNNHDVALGYEITMVFKKDLLSVYINDNFVGKLKSEGFGHKFKENISLVLWYSSAEFDDLRVWSLN